MGSHLPGAPKALNVGSATEERSRTSLDSIKNNCNSSETLETFPDCGKYTFIEQLDDPPNTLRLIRAYCGRWKCGRCGPRKLRVLRHNLIRVAAEKGLTRFLTLTVDPEKTSQAESIEFINSQWAKLRVYLRRMYGKRIMYIKVIELQKNGFAHLHILINIYVQQSWIKKSWESFGAGSIVDIRYVDSHRIARYLSKYLSKSQTLMDLPAGVRRYSTSQNISLKEKKQTDSVWQFGFYSLEAAIEMWNKHISVVFCDDSGVLEEIWVSSPAY